MLWLGQVERRQGRFDEAIEQYREAIRINPRDAEARLGQLMSLVALERWAEARSRMEEAVSALPEQPAFAHALARLLVASPDDTVRDGPRGIQIRQQLSSAGPPTTDLGETIAMALA
jgi:Flp pilus assembly protein TadD